MRLHLAAFLRGLLGPPAGTGREAGVHLGFTSFPCAAGEGGAEGVGWGRPHAPSPVSPPPPRCEWSPSPVASPTGEEGVNDSPPASCPDRTVDLPRSSSPP